MKKTLIGIALLSLLFSGCGNEIAKEKKLKEKKARPQFMFWCYRKEIVSDTFHVPEMKTAAAAAYLQGRMKTIPGYVNSSYSLPEQTFTVEYQGSVVRRMNFEEAFALSGFRADDRPANPKAKIPAGVK